MRTSRFVLPVLALGGMALAPARNAGAQHAWLPPRARPRCRWASRTPSRPSTWTTRGTALPRATCSGTTSSRT